MDLQKSDYLSSKFLIAALRKVFFCRLVVNHGGIFYFPTYVKLKLDSLKKKLKLEKAHLKVREFKYKEKFNVQKFKVAGVPVEKVSLKGKTDNGKLVYMLHGGGYLMGLISVYRKEAEQIAEETGATVVNIDYRTAPRHVFPSAREDALAVYDELIKTYEPKNIVMMGDSAGGNLMFTHVAHLRETGRPMPKALLAYSPWCDLAAKGKSYDTNRYSDFVFGMKKDWDYEEHKRKMISAVCKPYAGETPLDHKELSPVYNSYEEFPPIKIIVGGAELLLSDSVTIYEKAKAANVSAEISVYNGMFHVFPFVRIFKEARIATKEARAYLKEQLYSAEETPETVEKEEKSA